jgi:hypothetical protein
MYLKYLFKLLGVMLVVPLVLIAGTPKKGDLSVAWEKPFGGEENDIATSVTSTRDDGYVVVGESHSFGESDFYMIKLKREQ